MGLNYDLPEKAWVASGDEANWEKGLENGIWGLQPQLKHHWDRIDSGDLVLFYCENKGVKPTQLTLSFLSSLAFISARRLA